MYHGTTVYKLLLQSIETIIPLYSHLKKKHYYRMVLMNKTMTARRRRSDKFADSAGIIYHIDFCVQQVDGAPDWTSKELWMKTILGLYFIYLVFFRGF